MRKIVRFLTFLKRLRDAAQPLKMNFWIQAFQNLKMIFNACVEYV